MNRPMSPQRKLAGLFSFRQDQVFPLGLLIMPDTYLRVSDIVDHLYQNRYRHFPEYAWTYGNSSLSREKRLARGERLHQEHGQRTFGKEGLVRKLARLISGSKPSPNLIDPKRVFSSDVSIYKGPIWKSDRFLITGKPDYVIAEGTNQVPIELKPTAADFYPHYIWQVKMYCLLLDPESRFSNYGYLEIKDGQRLKVEVTQDDKIWLVKLIQSMGYNVRM